MMLTEHRLTIEAKCPKDGTTDTYNTYVRTTATISVEEILALAKHITEGKCMYQEELTRLLASRLPDLVEVETHGIHSGVYTTCRYSA